MLLFHQAIHGTESGIPIMCESFAADFTCVPSGREYHSVMYVLSRYVVPLEKTSLSRLTTVVMFFFAYCDWISYRRILCSRFASRSCWLIRTGDFFSFSFYTAFIIASLCMGSDTSTNIGLGDFCLFWNWPIR